MLFSRRGIRDVGIDEDGQLLVAQRAKRRNSSGAAAAVARDLAAVPIEGLKPTVRRIGRPKDQAAGNRPR
jgi:hypothetical protein